MIDRPDDRHILKVCEELALAAGHRIMEIVRGGFEAEQKADSSPVTLADRDAERIIVDGLRAQFPTIPIVAEEEASEGKEPTETGDEFFLVDPLDGTREFVRDGDDFTVNIGLVRHGEPVIGIVYAPARHALYAGRPGWAEMIETDGEHRPARRVRITVSEAAAPLRIVASRSHNTPETDAFIARHDPCECVQVGSSLKFCLLATGEADLYPRMGRTMQWDTAAGDAVLRAAGGMTRTLSGTPFRYGRGITPNDEHFANGHFIAEGKLPPA